MQGRIEIEDKIELGIQEKLEKYPPFVSEWYYALRAKGDTVKTCRNYINNLEHFITAMEYDLLDFEIEDITQNDLIKYFIMIQYKDDGHGNKVKTTGSYLNSVWFALNNFFEYQYEIGRIKKNYMKIVKPAKSKNNIKRQKETPMLTSNDFNKMLCKIPGTTPTIIKRNKAILLIFMTTGMRRDALCQINVSDLNLETNEIIIVDKEEKTHIYPLTEKVMLAIQDWINVRETINKGSDALFVTYQGQRMTGNSIYKMIKQCSQKALGYAICPHKFRSGLCSILYQETNNIEFVRRTIGHSSVATTQKYIKTDNTERQIASDIMAKLI